MEGAKISNISLCTQSMHNFVYPFYPDPGELSNNANM